MRRAFLLLSSLFCFASCCDAIELVTPIETSPQFQLSNLRKEKDDRGKTVLAFDFKRTKKGEGTAFVKGKSSSGYVSITATLPSWQESGTLQLSSYGSGDLNIDLEIYIAQIHTVGEKQYVYSMISNAVRIGNPGEPTKPRDWTPEEKAGYEEYLKNKPRQIKRYAVTIDVPTNAVKVPNTAKLTKGTKLQACYSNKWYPMTVLDENDDGSVQVRWDDYGPKFDCSMLRSELIIEKRVLGRLAKHPENHFPDTPPGIAPSDPNEIKKVAGEIPTEKPRKDYPVSIDVPSDSQFVPDDVTLPTGTPLQACYARKWNPITHLSHNKDGTLTIRWDDYGPTFDCGMSRNQLIIKKSLLSKIQSGSSSSSAPAAEMRTWTDATGRFEVKAELVEKTSTHVTLLTEKGKKVTLPLTKLSQRDQDYLAGTTSTSENPFE